MKKFIIFISFLAVAISFPGCKKDLLKITMKTTPTASTVSPLSATTFTPAIDNAANTFQTFTWSAADFGFKSQVIYTVEVDQKSDNFSSPAAVTVVTSVLTSSITIGDFNKVLLNMGLAPGTAVALQFRVKAVVNSNVDPVYSNILEATVTPYAVVFPPIFMTGDATGGWGWTLYQYKELRSPSPNVYQTIGYFVNGGAFRFFKQTDWSPTSWNFPYFTGTISTLLANASDGDSNFRFTGTTGYYQVTVNMTAKSVAMVSVPEPTLFMTGAALGGWDWTTHFVKLTWKSNGIFQAAASFVTANTFRFFAQQDWGPTGYNYPYFAGGTVPNVFSNANDGDKNFLYSGTTGSHTITVNMLDLIIAFQ